MQTWSNGEYSPALTDNPYSRLPLRQELSEWPASALFSFLSFSLTYTQASSIENKQDWIKHIREVIQERTVHLKGALKEPIHIPKPSTAKHKARRYNLRPVKLSYTLRNVVFFFFLNFFSCIQLCFTFLLVWTSFLL